MDKAKFYCDESGTTGTNWTDENQPLMVYGGWLILEENVNSVQYRIRELFQNFKGEELKSARFFKGNRSKRIFAELFDIMLSEVCFPIFTVVDKRYAVSLKLVETFFDPAYNKSLDNKISWDFSLKKALANTIYEEDVIIQFSKLMRHGELSIKEMQDIRGMITSILKDAKHIESNLKGLSDNELQEMIDEYKGDFMKRTLTIPSLNDLMQLVQKFAFNHSLSVDIVHDNILGYDSWIETFREIYLSNRPVRIMKIDDVEWYSSLPNIKTLSFVDSKDELFVQVSDLLCGFTARSFKKLQSEKELEQHELEFLEKVFALGWSLDVWKIILPDAEWCKFFRAVGFSDIQSPDNSFVMLNMRFSRYTKKNYYC